MQGHKSDIHMIYYLVFSNYLYIDNNNINLKEMKEFFNKLWNITKLLCNGSATKHQKWLTYGTLVFGLVISLIFNTIISALLMFVGALLVELIYCFVPTTNVRWFNRWYELPDFKEFKNDREHYIANPRHQFKPNNFWFVMIAIIIFIILKLLFLIF